MNKNLLHSDVQEFINNHLKSDLPTLILKGSPFEKVSIQEIAEQIQCKSKALSKLPTYFLKEGIYYPKVINIEQCSSETTALYKSMHVSGKLLIDLTGGFGVDTYYFSKKMDQVIHCEIDEELSKIVDHNAKVLDTFNLSCEPTDGINYINSSSKMYDWIYVDPSRRNEKKGKVFQLKDCIPDVSEELPAMLKHSQRIMIKLSPFLDLASSMKGLEFVREIHVVAVKNEVKELLFIVEKNYQETCKLIAVNINKSKFRILEGSFPSVAKASYSLPKKYLYEPNAAILKAGLFNEVSSQLHVNKIHANSHLYTSDQLIDFPGRRFEIICVERYQPKLLKKKLSGTKANITTRNFHDSVAQIRKNTGIKEGGDNYLFFTTDLQDKAVVIHCKKV